MKRLATFSIFLLGGVWCLQSVFAGEKVSAKIGVQVLSGDLIKRARTHDRLKKNDRLRIYVEPAFDGFVYVVYKGPDEVTLLSPQSDASLKKGRRMTLPSAKEYYEIDGESALESFTIICSPESLEEVANYFSNDERTQAEWLQIERRLSEKSKIDLHQKAAKPFGVAGNVRTPEEEEERLVGEFKQLFGNGMIVQSYEFRVKK